MGITPQMMKAYAALGFKSFELNADKRPVRPDVSWKDYASINETKPPEWGKIYAAVVPSSILVVDIDAKKQKKGRESWAFLCEDLGLSDEERTSMLVQTPTGGYHLYFRKPENTVVKYCLKDYPDIEFISSTKTLEKYVVGALSEIPEGEYQLINDETHLRDVPPFLLAFLETTEHDNSEFIEAKQAQELDAAEDIETFKGILHKHTGAIEGAMGDHETFTVACQGRDLGLSGQKTLELMIQIFNPKCQPPWPPTALAEKVKNAYAYASGTQGSAALSTMFTDLGAPAKDEIKWDIGKDKMLKPTLRNCVNLTLLHKSVQGSIRQNAFANTIEICGPVPWTPHRAHRTHRWSDEDLLHYRLWLADEHQVSFDEKTAQDAILRIAIANKYHPIHDYLTKLKWDGIKRLDHWLHLYCGAAQNAYTNKAGVITLVGAVKRVFEPGCKFDHVLVLEGDQGTFKSSLVQVLGGDWYICPTSLDPKAPDSVAVMQKGWILEIAEMAAFRGYDTDEIKAFITREVDEVRLAYGRNVMEYRRHGICIGTFNPHKYASYLRDTTGNRRFLPIACGPKIAINDLARDRDQLWAEAYQRYLAGEAIHIVKGSPEEIIHSNEVKNRLVGDAWETIIAEYLALHKITTISVNAVYTDCLMRAIGTCTRSDQMRIASILKDLGFVRERNKTGTGYVYTLGAEKPDTPLGDLLDALRHKTDADITI